MEVQEYLATIGIRSAELSGLKELPASTKDRLTPVVLLAPWLATSPLARAIQKFEESYPSRDYFIDVDTYYRIIDNPNEAKAQWSSLAQRPANLQVWWSLLADFRHANPCLLMADQNLESARDQITWARENDRSFCIRLNLAEGGAGIPLWMPQLITELASEGTVDYAVVFEFGWVTDALSVATLASGYANTFFSTLPAEVPIAISCTTFPSDFTVFDGTIEHRFTNRQLVALIQQGTNHPRIIYGDWASTRPRSYGHASTPKNRIDFPADDAWYFARNNGEQVSFPVAAQRIVNCPAWTGNLGIWGEQLIEGTAQGQTFALNTMPKMYAARINIHLHRQAYYGQLPPPASLDEAWTDDDL